MLQHSALRHQQQAEKLAELGDGAGAAREANLAVSDEEAARRHAESQNRYWTSEVLMH